MESLVNSSHVPAISVQSGLGVDGLKMYRLLEFLYPGEWQCILIGFI